MTSHRNIYTCAYNCMYVYKCTHTHTNPGAHTHHLPILSRSRCSRCGIVVDFALIYNISMVRGHVGGAVHFNVKVCLWFAGGGSFSAAYNRIETNRCDPVCLYVCVCLIFFCVCIHIYMCVCVYIYIKIVCICSAVGCGYMLSKFFSFCLTSNNHH